MTIYTVWYREARDGGGRACLPRFCGVQQIVLLTRQDSRFLGHVELSLLPCTRLDSRWLLACLEVHINATQYHIIMSARPRLRSAHAGAAASAAPGCILPRCMECRRGLAMRKLSVRPSVCQTRGLCQNGRKICPDFYTTRKII